MHAKDHSLNEVLKERQQWVIPVYQRHYAWEIATDKQLPKLFDDIRERAVEVLDGEKPSPHFVGAIIFSEPENQPFGTIHKRFLVDGQQRVTTFSLVLCALRELAEKYDAGQLVNAINKYIFNATNDQVVNASRERFKLWSSSFDRPQYVVVAEQGSKKIRSEFPEYFFNNGKLKSGNAPKLINAYWYLVTQFESFITENSTSENITPTKSIDAILTGFLKGFQIVVVQLDQHDDPQAIFASLNGRAEPLTAFDLIRNDIFHRARRQHENEDDLYDRHWKKLETKFWKTEVKQGRLKRPRTDHLIVHTLVAETAQDVSVGQVANEYQTYATQQNFGSVADEIQNLLKYANVYAAMERQDSNVPEYRIAKILNVWDISSMHPLVLWTAVQDFDDETKSKIYSILESYIVRRDICGLTRKNYNKVVPALLRAMLDEDEPLMALKQHFLKLEGEASRFPSDADIKTAFKNRPVYNIGSKKLRYILNEIELQMRSSFDESVSIDLSDLTIEHIIPQKWAENWPLPNGEIVEFEDPYKVLSIPDRNLSSESRDMMEKRQTAKHAFGNLTMITKSLNPSLSNSGWSKKKPKLSTSLLAVNRGIANEDTWNEQSIARRGLKLADIALAIWPQQNSAE